MLTFYYDADNNSNKMYKETEMKSNTYDWFKFTQVNMRDPFAYKAISNAISLQYSNIYIRILNNVHSANTQFVFFFFF